MADDGKHGRLSAGGFGWSNCVFCGKPVGKAARSREHILPMWLLRATGDPNRLIKIETDPITGKDVCRPASTFHFPACQPCNEHYGKTLEVRAKKAIETLIAGKSLEVSQCYSLLDWLDKVRVGLWLGYNMLHKEQFAPRFRISQRLGTKDRVAIVSVDPQDHSKGFAFGGLDNQIFRTSQAGMFIRINNARILSVSFDGVISRFAGMPYPKELLALSNDPDRLSAIMAPRDYRLKQNWKEFVIPGTTVIAQACFWLGNCVEQGNFYSFINQNTLPRLRKIPKLRKPADLNQFVQTQLISNATGVFCYHLNKRKRIRFMRAKDNTDFNFVKTLYSLFSQRVLPLNPTRVIDPDGTKRGIVLLEMLWLEKATQIVLRLREMGMGDERLLSELVDELQKVCRIHEESVANHQGTCVLDATP
jgi:hypothetical protein